MKWLLIIPLLCVHWLCLAQEGIYVPDSALREALRKQGFMTGDTIFIQDGRLQLDISKSNIHDLTGLRAFRDLRSLNAAANQLTKLNDLPPKLTALSVFNNQIESVDFKQIPAPLENLELGRNPVHTLLNLPNGLQSLRLSNCQLDNLDAIEKWPDSLKTLDISNNPLDSIKVLPNKLQSLNLANCQLRRLPALPATLNYLNYVGNPIDTALLPAIFKTCPCKSLGQNCLPTELVKWKIFGQPAATFTIGEFDKIRNISIKITTLYNWIVANDTIEIAYERDSNLFKSTKAFHKYSGRFNPKEALGSDARLDSVWFERQFSAQKLFKILHNLYLPNLQMNNQNFDYTKSAFKIDLAKLPKAASIGSSIYYPCEDGNDYFIDIEFIKKDSTSNIIHLGFNTCFELSTIAYAGREVFPIQQMLEWMYLYQLSHLFFSENVALNKSHFNEKSMEDLAEWAKKFFPELNNE